MPLPYVDLLESAANRFADVVAASSPTTPVLGCPGWTIADLTEHLTDVHSWARSMVTGEELPNAGSGTVRRFRAGADALVTALRERPADAPCRAVYPPDVAGTWARRQALETTIHLWDATVSTGGAASLPAGLAADGVAEVTDDLYPRQVRLGRQHPLAATVAFRLDDVDETVLLVGTDDGLEARSTLSGTAADVLLVLWGRRSIDDVDVVVSGEEAALWAALRAELVP